MKAQNNDNAVIIFKKLSFVMILKLKIDADE
jgi:hypothetical protein